MFVGATLVWGGELITGAAVGAAAWWLVRSGLRAYPLLELLVVLGFGIVLAWLAMRTLYTALEWAWTMQQEARRLLDLSRDRQGELNRTLRSLDLTNSILLRTQNELIVARQQAEEAQRLKEQFAANVSHEFRTPLNLILGFSEVMHLTPEVYGSMEWPSTLRQDIYQIHRNSRHLLEMINDVLDLSRFEVVGFALDRELAPLEPLLEDTLEIVQDLFRDAPVELELAVDAPLPLLDIDRTRIRQVLLNLLNNAARFTQEGIVRVSAGRIEHEVQISVSDTGPGIPQEELSLIFDEFYQVDRSLNRQHGGAGLGLAICKRFVTAHDGRIWAESQLGTGSTFHFTLPIPGEYVPTSPLARKQWPERAPPDRQGPLLIVDPDPALADLLRRRVESTEVVQIPASDRLLEEVMEHHPRAVVYNVPPRASKELSLPPLPVPVVECSLPSRAWVAAERAMAAYLTKPVTAADLQRELERLDDVRDVLVVDDDRGFCQLIERTLSASSSRYRVRQAYDGWDGLGQMRAHRPDVVLLDLIMPDLDGFQVLEEMRSDPALDGVEVILVTAADLVEEALVQRSKKMTIHRPDGLRPGEMLRCLEAVMDVLEPRYDERSVPATLQSL